MSSPVPEDAKAQESEPEKPSKAKGEAPKPAKGHGPRISTDTLVALAEGYAVSGTIRGAADYAGIDKTTAGELLEGTKGSIPLLRIILALVDQARKYQNKTLEDWAEVSLALDQGRAAIEDARKAERRYLAAVEALEEEVKASRTIVPQVNTNYIRMTSRLEKLDAFLSQQSKLNVGLARQLKEDQAFLVVMLAAMKEAAAAMKDAGDAIADALHVLAVRLQMANDPKVLLVEAKARAITESGAALIKVLAKIAEAAKGSAL